MKKTLTILLFLCSIPAWGQMSNPLIQGILAQKTNRAINVTVSYVIVYDSETALYSVHAHSTAPVFCTLSMSYKAYYKVNGTQYNVTLYLPIYQGNTDSDVYFFNENEIPAGKDILNTGGTSCTSGNVTQQYTYY